MVMTPSAVVASDLGGHANLRVIPWGVDPAFSPDPGPTDIELREAVPHLPEGPFVLCLGGARPKKRLDLVVAGAAASTPPLGVVCTGATTPESEALAATFPGLLLTGVLDPSLIPALLRASSCSAILSTSEGFGLPALESLRCGTPLVVARGTVQAETAAGFGIEVNPNDPASVAAGFAEAREESEASARRTGGLAHAQAMTWERTAGELVSAWGSLI
jgi:glycosyltransferase involved in cell wall biosynthesis